MTQREVIAKAIYEAPDASSTWEELPEGRREGWLLDADRVIEALRCADCGSPITGRELTGISG